MTGKALTLTPATGGAWEHVGNAIAELIDAADLKRMDGESTFRLASVTVDGDRFTPSTLVVTLRDAAGAAFMYRAYIARDGQTVIDG